MPTLNWLNRNETLTIAKKEPYRLLEHDPELSYGDNDTNNMIIQGDNLSALKALLPYYAGKVKCIYIDPPFNTKQAFAHYDDNLEHSIWLSLLYPRLELLKEFLREDGTFIVHIDDNELGYLVVIMDELLGRKNRISIVTFKQGAATGHKSINPGMVTTTNYLVVYACNKDKWKPNRLFTGRERDKRYTQVIKNSEEHYSKWRLITLSKAFSLYKGKTIKELKSSLGDLYEEELNEFVISNAHRVVQAVRPAYKSVSAKAREYIDRSLEDTETILLLKREQHSDMYFKGGQRLIFYKNKLKEIDGTLGAGEPLTNLWDDLLSNNLHNEGGVKFPKSKKPESLIKRIIELTTSELDIVFDSFLGSGTTAAVAHKMNRQYIGIEMGEHATTLCAPRMKKVIGGEQGGISKAVKWKGGGGFRFYHLGSPIFDEYGKINKDIKFPTLASHIWFSETNIPLAEPPDSPLLGIHDDVAYYLLFNGILGDKRPDGGNVLTSNILKSIPEHNGTKIIFGEMSRFGSASLKKKNIIFKQIPYDIKAR